VKKCLFKLNINISTFQKYMFIPLLKPSWFRMTAVNQSQSVK